MNAPALASITALDHRILREAAEWYAILLDEQVTDKQKADWQHWLRQPQHELAWQQVSRISQRFQGVQQQTGAAEAREIIHTVRADRVSRRKLLGGGLSCLALWLVWRHTPVSNYTQQTIASWRADYRTGTGETRLVQLADGGSLWLNTSSAVDVNYDANRRELVLRHGEVLIQTASDSRPFYVHTAEGRLQALGTRFTVYQQQGQTLLSVQQGAVRIETWGGQQAVLEAGQQTRFSEQMIAAREPAALARESWAEGMLAANNVSLKDFLAELSRYHHGHIAVAPEVAEIPVIGIYPAHDKGRVLAMLAQALPIRVEQTLPWWVNVEAR